MLRTIVSVLKAKASPGGTVVLPASSHWPSLPGGSGKWGVVIEHKQFHYRAWVSGEKWNMWVLGKLMTSTTVS